MINKYKNISIIYGGSGKECALKMDQELKRLHLDEFYPIKSYILANEILSSTSILDTVKNIISSSSACIIILTFDDVNQTRVRQNVLIEIGLALSLIDKENCFFISEKEKLPEDFPSDLKNVVNPNYFDKNCLEDVVKKTSQEIIRHLKVKNHRDILADRNYIFDYKKVLDDIPVQIFEEKADVQLEHILDEWENNIESFEFVVERVMYLAERIKFFPDFNRNKRFFRFLSNVAELIKPDERDFEFYDSAYLISICNFFGNILEYTKLKLDENVLKCIAKPEEYREEVKRYQIEFENIADDLRVFIEEFENGTSEYNWLIKVLAYEYVALAYMKYIACNNTYDNDILELMNYIIGCYEKVIQTGRKNDPCSRILWQGYAEYDLTRAYENMYKITGEEQYLERIEEYSRASIVTRQKWFKDNPFKGVFSSVLSFEYFLVYRYEYELRYKLKRYSNDSKRDIINGLDQLKDELNRYCETTALGRLYDMRDGIDELINNLKSEG